MNKVIAGLAALMLLGAGETAVAGGSQAKSVQQSKASEGTRYTWRDGGAARSVWLDENFLAEFEPSESGAEAVKKVDGAARAVGTKSRAVRVWKLGSPAGADRRRAVKEAAPEGRFSPVFRDGPGEGRMRALPGGVVVEVNPTWDEAATRAWAASKGLEVEKKLPGKSFYLLRTGPGLETLELANELDGSGEVRQAFPNWWQEAYGR